MDSVVNLDGLPNLQSCHLSVCCAEDGKRADLYLSRHSFRNQRGSLQDLKLRGVGTNVHVKNLSCDSIGLPALRHLTIRNLGLDSVDWLTPRGTPLAVAPLLSLNLDDNEDLQLSRLSAVVLLSMSTLTKVSMRKKCGASPAGGSVDSADTSPQKAVWSAESVRCIASMAAAKPAFRLCF